MNRPLVRVLGPVCLVLSVVAVGLVALDAPFTYDDRIEVIGNLAVRDAAWWSALPQYNPWRTLLLYTYALNWAWGGLEPRGYHIVSIAIHALNTVLAWRLAHRILSPSRALFAAALWSLHPMTTEGVSYISGRSDALVATFMLAATLAWLDDARTPTPGKRIAAWVAMALACLSKETSIVLPPLLLAVELWLVAGGRWRLLRWKLYAPFVLLVALSAAARAAVAGWPVPEVPRTLAAHVLTQAEVWSRYLQLWLVPWGQSILHPVPAEAGVKGGLLLLGWAALAVWAVRKRGVPAVSFAFWALPLLITSAFVLKETMAEHRAYLAGLGLALYVASRAPEKGWIFLVPLVLAGLTVRRNLDWREETRLWSGAAARWPGSADAWYGYGDSLRIARQWQSTEEAYLRATEIEPLRVEAWVNVGVARANRRDGDGARAAFETALRLEPRHCAALNNLAGLKAMEGDLTGAASAYEGTLRACPDNAEAHFRLGNIWASRDGARAIFHFRAFLRTAPSGRLRDRAIAQMIQLGATP